MRLAVGYRDYPHLILTTPFTVAVGDDELWLRATGVSFYNRIIISFGLFTPRQNNRHTEIQLYALTDDTDR